MAEEDKNSSMDEDETDLSFIGLIKNAHRPNIHKILQDHEDKISDTQHLSSDGVNFKTTPIISSFNYPAVLNAPSTKFSRHFPDLKTSLDIGNRLGTSDVTLSGASVRKHSRDHVATPTSAIKNLQNGIGSVASLRSDASAQRYGVDMVESCILRNWQNDKIDRVTLSPTPESSPSLKLTTHSSLVPGQGIQSQADINCSPQSPVTSQHLLKSEPENRFDAQPSTLSGAKSSTISAAKPSTMSTLSGVLEQMESHPELRYRESINATMGHQDDRPEMIDKEIQVDIGPVGEIKTESLVTSRPSTAQSAKAMTWAYFTGKIPEKPSLQFIAEVEEKQFDNFFEDLVFKREKEKAFTKKKNMRAKLTKFKLHVHDLKTWYRRWKLKRRDIPVFRKEIQKIEDCFGSSIVSFFVFCRYVLLLNLVMSLVWSSFVVIPTAVTFNYNFTKTFYFTSIFDGKNALEESWLFYCSYNASFLPTYNLSLAYLAVILCTYFGSFLFVLQRLAQSLGQDGDSRRDVRYPFCHLLFSSWDFSLVPGRKAAEHLHNGIINMVKDSVHDIRTRQQIQSRTLAEKCNVYSRRTLAWIITGLLIGGGSGAIVYLVMFVDFAALLGETADSNHFLVVYGLTLSFLLINSIVPAIVEQLPKFERYMKGKFEVNVTLSRIFLLQLANLFALVISVYRKVTAGGSGIGCAGTTIGQEIYKLVLLDTLTSIVTTVIPPFILRYIFKKKVEFKIPKAVLKMVYRQALIWFGMITCPVLPLIGALSTTIYFVTNYIVVMKCCKPATKRWNQSRHNSAFYGLLLATLFPVLVPVSVMIGSEDLITLGAEDKGPFEEKRPLAALTSSSLPEWGEQAFKWLSSPVVLLPAILIMMAVINFQRLRIKRETKHRTVFHQQLQQEREENKTLAKKLHQ